VTSANLFVILCSIVAGYELTVYIISVMFYIESFTYLVCRWKSV